MPIVKSCESACPISTTQSHVAVPVLLSECVTRPTGAMQSTLLVSRSRQEKLRAGYAREKWTYGISLSRVLDSLDIDLLSTL